MFGGQKFLKSMLNAEVSKALIVPRVQLITNSDSTAKFTIEKCFRFWRFVRAWLGQRSEDHEAMNFLGINCCSTYKKVSKNPHFIRIYFHAFTQYFII